MIDSEYWARIEALEARLEELIAEKMALEARIAAIEQNLRQLCSR